MEKKLLLIISFFVMSFGYAQVVGDQTDDFEDGTVQGWLHAVPNPFDPENIATGGPAGADWAVRSARRRPRRCEAAWALAALRVRAAGRRGR